MSACRLTGLQSNNCCSNAGKFARMALKKYREREATKKAVSKVVLIVILSLSKY